jgi:hypothetical protein
MISIYLLGLAAVVCSMPIRKDPKELDVAVLIGGIVGIGAAISTIIGSIIVVSLKNEESSELRENNIALRQAGAEALEIIEYHITSILTY